MHVILLFSISILIPVSIICKFTGCPQKQQQDDLKVVFDFFETISHQPSFTYMIPETITTKSSGFGISKMRSDFCTVTKDIENCSDLFFSNKTKTVEILTKSPIKKRQPTFPKCQEYRGLEISQIKIKSVFYHQILKTLPFSFKIQLYPSCLSCYILKHDC